MCGCLVICVLVFNVICIVRTVFFVLFHLCIYILISFACTSVRTTAPGDNLIAVNNDDDDDNNNNK
jgi:hypothetical protein